MIAIGIGSTSAATAADIVAAIREVERRAGSACGLVASLRRGGDLDAVITAASAASGRPLRLIAHDELVVCASDCVTHSAASIAAYGLPSVAEAASIAAAGAGSRLLIARIVFDRVTAAAATRQVEERPA